MTGRWHITGARNAASAALLLIALLFAGGAGAAENLTVRAGQHDGFGRIVFDTPGTMGYSTSVDGSRLTVAFDAPVAADVTRVARVIGRHVRAVRIEGDTRVVAELTGPHTVRDFRNEGSIVIDLRPVGDEDGAADRPEIGTRFGRHPNFSRMVFDWVGRVGYRLNEDADGAVSVRFDRAADVRIDPIALRVAPGFTRVRARTGEGSTRVDMTVNGRVRHFRDGFKVVVDVFDAPDGRNAQDRKPSKARAIPASLTPEPKAPEIPQARAARADAEPVEPPRVRAQTPDAQHAGPVSLAPPGSTRSSTSGSAQAETVQPTHTPTLPGAAAATSEPVNLLPVTLQPAPKNPATLPDEAERLNIEITTELDGALIRFPFIRQTGAAIFRRGGSLWVVFDTLARIDTDLILAEAGAFLREIEQIPHQSATVLRLVTIPGYNALSVRDDTRWEVVLAPQLHKPENPLGVTTVAGSLPSVTVGPTWPAPPLSLVDPEVGDEIRVVPVYDSGEGVAQRFLYPDFRLLASIQGVALVPLSDRLDVRAGEDRVIVSASGGLRLTETRARNLVLAAGDGDEVARMFRFVEWRHAELGDYDAAHRELLAQLQTMDDDARGAGRLELARFYLANGLAGRVLGLLDVLVANNPEMARVPSFKAMRGAARFLMGDIAGAERDLFDRDLDAEPEIDLWRAAVRGAQGEVVASSFELQTAERFVQEYPDALRVHFAFLGAEVALSSSDPVAGEFWLEVIGDAELTPSEADRKRVFEADIAARNGEIDTAVALYDRTINGRDRLSRALATLAKTELLLSEEDMTASEAVDELDRLRYVWRGDGLEFRILRRLGELEIAAGRYRDGLKTLKRAASNFPEHPAAARLADDMRLVFERLYLDGEADDMEPVSAIALFNEFRELAPAGTAGDAMIRRLADRLVAVDLLDQAAELLAHQVEFRLEGEEKAEVGTRLAMVHLLNRAPERALEALAASEVPSLPMTIRQERSIARARAQILLGDFDAALASLSGLSGEETDLLRAEIHWKMQDWREAAVIFSRLAGPIPTDDRQLDDRQSRFILNSAVALALGGESTRLTALRQLYMPAMANSPYAADFKAITAVEASPRDFADVLQRVSQVEDFEAFMDSYKARLSGNAPVPAKS